jgi:phage baseplate assembly protein W
MRTGFDKGDFPDLKKNSLGYIDIGIFNPETNPVVTGKDSVDQSVTCLLLTKQRERINQPLIGCMVDDLLFELDEPNVENTEYSISLHRLNILEPRVHADLLSNNLIRGDHVKELGFNFYYKDSWKQKQFELTIKR